MLREYLTNKYILSTIGFLTLLSVACVLWYRYDTAHDKQQLAQDRARLRQHEASKATKIDTETKQSTDQTSTDSTVSSGEKPITKTTDDLQNNSEAETKQSVIPVSTGEGRVSAFGFGLYPELPADFPFQDMFDPPYYSQDPDDPHKDNPNYELMDRLWVELWKRGEKVEGFGTLKSTGLFYPTIHGTIYVEWAPRWKVFGKGFGRTISYIDCHPDDMDRLRHIDRESDIPSDFKVFDISEGINPYTFLNLPKNN